jgi:hypothetical protein
LLTNYYRLRRRKGGNGFGYVPIEWPDIDAFQRNARIEFAPWEVQIIEHLDDIFMRVHSKPAND